MEKQLILGIDPGTTVMGYALLQVNSKTTEMVDLGVITMLRLPNQNEKLKKIFESTIEIIEKYHPTLLAIEAPFFGKNAQSMLKLGRAQGVVIAACLHYGMEVFEYLPRKVKQSVTGNGNASKEQVAAMLKTMYAIPECSHYYDATDALAVAVCHFMQNKITTGGEKFSGWDNFISKNSDRLIP